MSGQTPRTWGWTVTDLIDTLECMVNPTHVGVDQWWTISPPTSEGNPHTRGDGPKYPDLPKKLFQQAPRAWGWTELNAVDSPRRRW